MSCDPFLFGISVTLEMEEAARNGGRSNSVDFGQNIEEKVEYYQPQVVDINGDVKVSAGNERQGRRCLKIRKILTY